MNGECSQEAFCHDYSHSGGFCHCSLFPEKDCYKLLVGKIQSVIFFNPFQQGVEKNFKILYFPDFFRLQSNTNGLLLIDSFSEKVDDSRALDYITKFQQNITETIFTYSIFQLYSWLFVLKYFSKITCLDYIYNCSTSAKDQTHSPLTPKPSCLTIMLHCFPDS